METDEVSWRRAGLDEFDVTRPPSCSRIVDPAPSAATTRWARDVGAELRFSTEVTLDDLAVAITRPGTAPSVYRLPVVAQVAAVAMPDRELGERVCLYIVPRAGATVTLEEIREFMERAGVARFMLPEHLVLVGELAVTTVGKIDKKALRADVAARLDGARAAGAPA